MSRMIRARRCQCSGSQDHRSVSCQQLGTRYGLGRWDYPGDNLDEVEMRRGAENVVHADG